MRYVNAETITHIHFVNLADPTTTLSNVGQDAALNGMLVRSFVNLRLSVTPETVDSQHAALLRFVRRSS